MNINIISTKKQRSPAWPLLFVNLHIFLYKHAQNDTQTNTHIWNIQEQILFHTILRVEGINTCKHKYLYMTTGRRPLKLYALKMHNRHKREIVIFNTQRSYGQSSCMKRKFTTPNVSYMCPSSQHHRKGKLWPWFHSSPYFVQTPANYHIITRLTNKLKTKYITFRFYYTFNK